MARWSQMLTAILIKFDSEARPNGGHRYVKGSLSVTGDPVDGRSKFCRNAG
jgi:hypothetical protein